MIRLAVDGTPLLGRRSGIGEVVGGIVPLLARRDDLAVTAYALTLRGRHDLAARVPAGVRATTRAYPARAVRRAWLRADHPRIERWTGPVDVVHGMNYVGPPTRARLVVSVYDLGFMRDPEHAAPDALDYPPLLRRAIARGAWIHTTSDFVRDEVVERLDADPERVVRVYPGVPPVQGGSAARGRALAGADRYVLAVGTIEPRKNYPTLVRAFDAVASEQPDVRLVVAGDPDWGADAFDAARHRDRVLTPGYVPDEDRRDLLAGASALAYPSLYEGFGFPPLEAMAVGVPVVAARVGSIPEVVGDAALLPDPRDPDDVAGALATALDDDDARAELVAAGHRRRLEFSWERAADELVDLYRSTLA
jgi:glycosyltransferase involved in cell wall biosynthesis